MKQFLYLVIINAVVSLSLHAITNDPFQKPSSTPMILQGIASTQACRVCLLSKGEHVAVCHEGERFENYTIEEIGSTSVTLRSSSQCITLMCS